MKIDLKKPKYVIPIIILPFLFIFFYVYKSSIGNDSPKQSGKDSLQTELVDVSDHVKNQSLTDKLHAFRNDYKQADGYTAIGQIHEEKDSISNPITLYNEKEKLMLDSIEKAMKRKYTVPINTNSKKPESYFPDAKPVTRRSKSYDQQDMELATALMKINQTKSKFDEKLPDTKQHDPMALFRQQMALIDSMGKANDPEYQAEIQRKQQHVTRENENKEKKKLRVKRSSGIKEIFNTITAEVHETLITAIVDQNITGYSGSRLRIRLLEDLMVGRFLIKKGTYIYALISGFSGQRVNLTVNSIMNGKDILPVKLEVYDHDGLPGLYVPASAFREFAKELGSNSSQGISIQQAENNNQLVMSMIQKMFQSTSTAVSKLIRQNKAKIKYNSLIYLVDPDELKLNQNNY